MTNLLDPEVVPRPARAVAALALLLTASVLARQDIADPVELARSTDFTVPDRAAGEAASGGEGEQASTRDDDCGGEMHFQGRCCLVDLERLLWIEVIGRG